MNIEELIEIAKVRSGKSKGQMAAELGLSSQSAMTKMATGERDFRASEIIYLAAAAKLDPIETLKELEQSARPHLADVWEAVNPEKTRATVSSIGAPLQAFKSSASRNCRKTGRAPRVLFRGRRARCRERRVTPK